MRGIRGRATAESQALLLIGRSPSRKTITPTTENSLAPESLDHTLILRKERLKAIAAQKTSVCFAIALDLGRANPLASAGLSSHRLGAHSVDTLVENGIFTTKPNPI